MSATADLPSIPVEQWRWDLETEFEGPFPLNPTLVLQLDDDDGDGLVTTSDVPDIAVTHWLLGGLETATLTVLDGGTGEEKWSVDTPTIAGTSAGALLAAADLDDDGVVELIVTSRTEIHVFESDGRFAWSRPWPRALIPLGPTPGGLGIGVADFNQDGVPEIYAQDMVVSVDGSLTWVGGAGGPREFGDGYSFAVDLDPASPGLELLDGSVLYSATGAILHQNLALPRGHVAVADVDGDGDPEVAMALADSDVVLLDASLRQIGPTFVSLFGSYGCMAADLDADGRSEIVVPTNHELMAFEWDGVGLALKWSIPTRDGSCCARASAFDFDGDGAAEIVYRDMFDWFILCGFDGTILHRERFTSYTGADRLVVADIDADGIAEIVVTGAQGGDWTTDVIAYEVMGAVTPRSIWNQDGSHGTNINDDGTVPRFEEPAWTEHKSWLAQVPAAPSRTLDPFDDATATDPEPCESGLQLDWEAADVATASMVVTYDIHRVDGSGPESCEEALATPPVVTGLVDTSWRDEDAVPGQVHTYVIRAITGVGGCGAREICVEGVDLEGPPSPDGVYATLRAWHEGDLVAMTWTDARLLLGGESFHLLKASDEPFDFAQVTPPGFLERSHEETDTASPVQFFDLRVENGCGELSEDEYPPGP